MSWLSVTGPAGLRTRRVARWGTALVAVALVAGGLAGPAPADEIADARAEAARVADRIEDLRHEAEVLTEEFLDAQVARAELDERIAAAEARAARSEQQLDALRDALRAFAIDSYKGSGPDPMASLLAAGDANEIARRRGYVRSAAEDGLDLADQYKGAQAAATGDATVLGHLREEAAETEREIAAKREDTEARLAELSALERRVTGRLRELVEAEQRRRDEERRRQAAAAAARAEAQAREEAAARQEAEAARQQAAAAALAAATTTAPSPSSVPGGSGGDTGPDDGAGEAGPALPPPSSGAAAAIAAARTQLGVPYKWAGASPSVGFDCSGLVLWAWQHGGKSLPHSSRALYAMSRKIPVSQLQPGDLVFYNRPISHVGLYIGGGQMIHAPSTGDVVKIQSIYYWSALVGGGRI